VALAPGIAGDASGLDPAAASPTLPLGTQNGSKPIQEWPCFRCSFLRILRILSEKVCLHTGHSQG
jgi:hypothetical protein